MNKGAQVLLHYSISCLRLAIRLRMVGGAHPELGATQGEKRLPEPTDKEWIPVRHDAPGYSMDLTHHLHEKLGNSLCCVLRR